MFIGYVRPERNGFLRVNMIEKSFVKNLWDKTKKFDKSIIYTIYVSHVLVGQGWDKMVRQRLQK